MRAIEARENGLIFLSCEETTGLKLSDLPTAEELHGEERWANAGDFDE